MGKIDDRIEVDANCTGKSVPGTGNQAIKDTVKEVLNEGIRCLRDLGGPTASKMADSLVANVLTPAGTPGHSRPPLHIGCQLPLGTEVSASGTTAAVSVKNTDCDYPALYVSPGNMDGKVSKQTVFHELLHLAGIHGKQCFHNYSQAGAMELVEPCAAACIPSAGSRPGDKFITETSKKLCRGDFKNDPAKHAIEYAKTQSLQRQFAVAAQELRKAVMYDPTNGEAWHSLATNLQELPPHPERDLRILASMEMALKMTTDPAARDKIKNDPLYTSARSNLFANSDPRGYLSRHYFGDKIPTTEQTDLAVKVLVGRTIAQMTLESCGPMGKYTDGTSGVTASVDMNWNAGAKKDDPAGYPNCGKAFVMAYRSMYSPLNDYAAGLAKSERGMTKSDTEAKIAARLQPFKDDMERLQDTRNEMASGKSYDEYFKEHNANGIAKCNTDFFAKLSTANKPFPIVPAPGQVNRPGCAAPAAKSNDVRVHEKVASGCENIAASKDPILTSTP